MKMIEEYRMFRQIKSQERLDYLKRHIQFLSGSDKAIINPLFPQIKYSSNLLENAKSAYDFCNKSHASTIVEIENINQHIDFVISGIQKEIDYRNHKIKIGHIEQRPIISDIRLISVLKEVLFNALKYSPENSIIDIDSQTDSDYFTLRITNDIYGIGIPSYLEESVLYPFIRLSDHDDFYYKEPFSDGLGLTACESVMIHSGGLFRINEIEESGKNRISTQLIFPRTDYV